MHQIISGETHKIEIYDKKKVTSFLNTAAAEFKVFKNARSCVYNKNLFVDSAVLNFLNKLSYDNTSFEQLKLLMTH